MFPGQVDPDVFLDRLDHFLDAMHPETVIVGGHEDPVAIAVVREQIAQSRACMAFVRESIAEGLSAESTAEGGADRFPPQWIGFFYRIFTRSGGL